MKIFVKTLKGSNFEIEVKPEDTVADVKKNIEKVLGSDSYPASQQMLIHQGKVLKDDTTLEDNKVAEKSFVVIMLAKNKASSSGASTSSVAPASTASSSVASTTSAAPASTTSLSIPNFPSFSLTNVFAYFLQNKASSSGTSTISAAPASTAQPTSNTPPTQPIEAAPTPAPAVAPPQSAPESAPVPAPTASLDSMTDVYDQAASNLVAGSNLEGTVQHILDMGGGSWDRDTVVRALRAAFNNPERAVEYLYSGIPEQAELAPAAQPPAGELPVNPSAQATQPTVPSGGPNADPLDLFSQGPPNMGSNAGTGSLDFLRNSQQFQTLRAMVQANPQILQPMLQELGKQNPQLVSMIQEHRADFLRLINEPVEGEGNILGQLAEAMPQAITVTSEEQEAIERLIAMGFDRALVLEVFFACNKNEELAANYLLDHMHEFDE